MGWVDWDSLCFHFRVVENNLEGEEDRGSAAVKAVEYMTREDYWMLEGDF